MSQINTDTNNCSSNTNWNQISEKVGRSQGVPGGRDRGDCSNGCGKNLIAKYSVKGKMNNGPISKLTITKTGHRPT